MSIQNLLNPLNPLENPNDIDLKPFSNRKIIFNTMWERDINGVRKLELDAFRSLNSNVNQIYTHVNFVGSPVDGTTSKTTVTLFLVRKRLINLIDIWNRILNSGLFKTQNLFNSTTIEEIKMVGSNIFGPLPEYLFKSHDNASLLHFPLDFKTNSIFNKIQRFLTAYINNYNGFIINNASNNNYFNTLSTIAGIYNLNTYINIYHNPTKPSMMALIEELVTLYKSLLSETKIASKVDLGFNFDNLTFLTEEGRANILKLDAYKSNYKEVARLDVSDFNYLNNPESLALVSKWINEGSNLDKLYPQFGTEIYRNEESESWNYKNVIVDLASFKNDQSFTEETLGLTTEEFQKVQAKKYWTGSQLDMRKPLYFNTQFIDWANPDDQPYVMLYNGGTLVHIPDEVKEATHPVTIVEKESTFPDITIANDYIDLPQLKTGTYYMEFDLIMGSTNYTVDRKLFGPATADGGYLNGLILGGASPYSLYFSTAGTTVVINPTYANINAKLKIVNGINDNSCKVYINDELKATFTGRYDFASIQRFGSSSPSRKVGQAEIKNIKTKSFTGNGQEEAPDNQLNLAANFWKIGTSNHLDPLYNPKDDIKLRLGNQGNQSLNDVDKLDFFDNLTLYLKLNQ